MRGLNSAIASRISSLLVCLVAGAPLSVAQEPDLSAHRILSKMSHEERYPFVAGIVEGIAFHRYTVGNKDKAAMDCVYDWFYKGHSGQRTIDVIYAAFGQYPDYPPAAIVEALARKKCG